MDPLVNDGSAVLPITAPLAVDEVDWAAASGIAIGVLVGRGRPLLRRVLGIAHFALFVVVVALTAIVTEGSVADLAGGVAGVGVWALLNNEFARRSPRRVSEDRVGRTVSLNELGVTVTSSAGKEFAPWSAVVALTYDRVRLVITTEYNAFHVVSRSGFLSDAAFAAFVAAAGGLWGRAVHPETVPLAGPGFLVLGYVAGLTVTIPRNTPAVIPVGDVLPGATVRLKLLIVTYSSMFQPALAWFLYDSSGAEQAVGQMTDYEAQQMALANRGRG
jgi:hypothetical protein